MEMDGMSLVKAGDKWRKVRSMRQMDGETAKSWHDWGSSSSSSSTTVGSMPVGV